MFKIKHPLATLVVVAAALAVAMSALGWQGPPVVNEQFRPPPEVHPMTWCGEVEGTAVDTSIISSASTTEKSQGPIDNGDGTISFVTAINGLALKFQIPNGPVLKTADGQPLRSAGVLTFQDIFDAATGDYITTNVSFKGPHLGAEGVDICGPSVAYLLDP
jgi:hypothetical protein